MTAKHRTGEIDSAEDLRRTLATLRSAAVYDIFAQVALQRFCGDVLVGKADAASLTTTLPEGELTFQAFVDRLDRLNPEALVESKRNANRATTRGLLKESFRLTQAYCDRTDQTDGLKSQSWYSFARILVNYLSHSFRLELRKSDRNQLPATFDGYALDLAMDGEVIELPLEVLVGLVDEIARFAAQGLR